MVSSAHQVSHQNPALRSTSRFRDHRVGMSGRCAWVGVERNRGPWWWRSWLRGGFFSWSGLLTLSISAQTLNCVCDPPHHPLEIGSTDISHSVCLSHSWSNAWTGWTDWIELAASTHKSPVYKDLAWRSTFAKDQPRISICRCAGHTSIDQSGAACADSVEWHSAPWARYPLSASSKRHPYLDTMPQVYRWMSCGQASPLYLIWIVSGNHHILMGGAKSEERAYTHQGIFFTSCWGCVPSDLSSQECTFPGNDLFFGRASSCTADQQCNRHLSTANPTPVCHQATLRGIESLTISYCRVSSQRTLLCGTSFLLCWLPIFLP